MKLLLCLFHGNSKRHYLFSEKANCKLEVIVIQLSFSFLSWEAISMLLSISAVSIAFCFVFFPVLCVSVHFPSSRNKSFLACRKLVVIVRCGPEQIARYLIVSVINLWSLTAFRATSRERRDRRC